MVFLQRLNDFREKSVEIAGGAQLLREPPQLGLYRLYTLIARERRKQRDAGAQPPQGHTHLMESIAIPSKHRGHVGNQMTQASPANQGESAARVHSGN